MEHNVTITRLDPGEIAEFQAFCETHWGERHPLIHNKQLFTYYYREGKHINFVVAKDGDTGEMLGVCGFIKASLSQTPDIWLSYILSKKGAPHFLAFKMMDAIRALTNCRTMACNNIRKKTRGIYAFLGYTVGVATQFYRLNAEKPQYTLCNISEKIIPPVSNNDVFVCEILSHKELQRFPFDAYQHNRPYKDYGYTKQRYLNHPWLNYRLFRFEINDAAALLVVRAIEHGGACALRIVDFIGDRELIPLVGGHISSLIVETGSDFADWYAFGEQADFIAKAGFVPLEPGGANIIPTYLEPPKMENTSFYVFTSESENYMMFKADGDQDRPRLDGRD